MKEKKHKHQEMMGAGIAIGVVMETLTNKKKNKMKDDK